MNYGSRIAVIAVLSVHSVLWGMPGELSRFRASFLADSYIRRHGQVVNQLF
jgi:hypothetical protein